MTKPVLSNKLKEGKYDMSFVLLLNSTELAPQPTNENVSLELVP